MQVCGAIREVVNPQAGFTINMFLVPKKDGDWRPIISLKVLNQYVAKQRFKMEDIRTLKDIIHPRDYMAKLDLKDAYFRASSRRRQEVSQVRVGRQNVRVHMPSVWPQKCTLDIHKAVQTGPSIFTTTEDLWWWCSNLKK